MRPTQAFTTPSGKPFEVKTFLTARERNELRGVFLHKVQVDPTSGERKGDVYADNLIDDGNRKIIEIAVVSFDGSAENILGRIENAEHPQSAEDYDCILAEAVKIGNFAPAK